MTFPLGLFLATLGALAIASLLLVPVHALVYTERFFRVSAGSTLLALLLHPLFPRQASLVASVSLGGLFAHLALHVTR